MNQGALNQLFYYDLHFIQILTIDLYKRQHGCIHAVFFLSLSVIHCQGMIFYSLLIVTAPSSNRNVTHYSVIPVCTAMSILYFFPPVRAYTYIFELRASSPCKNIDRLYNLASNPVTAVQFNF